VYKGLKKTEFDDKLAKLVGHQGAAEGAISNFVYYILLLFLAILALGVAKLDKVSGPLQNMLSEFLSYIPNLVGAGVLLYFVLLVAKIVRNLASGLMDAAKLDEKLGAATGKTPVANSLAVALYSFIILLFIPAVLAVLGIDSLSKPVGDVVQSILGAVPNIIIASVLVAIGILIGQIARRLVTNLLEAAGADQWPGKLGLDIPQEGKGSLSNVVGLIVMISVAVLMIGAAINELDLGLLAGASEGFVATYFNVLLAVLVFGAGILLAKFAYKNLADKNLSLAKLTKYAILVITTVVALQRSNLAPELTGLPYTVAIYALGVAFGIGGAVAIGLGGRDYVARFLEKKG
ncbi:MAG: mechanosensitive ion channel, partial [Verrucomicrobiae bacterium]|nr:mechanosensitive ion channel [Verrucomicrobiae bacterium]NNJ85726.1 mechanosensitive ion channel [Akkermansiaceae bacterium]